MKNLVLVLAVVFMAAPVMAEVPDFNDGWVIVYAEQLPNGTIGATALNTDETAKWKAAVIIAHPVPGGIVPVIVCLYDGCNLKRFVLKDGAYTEFPFTDVEAERAIKNHLNQFVPRMEGV